MGFGGGSFMGGPLTLGQFGFMEEAEGQYNMDRFEDALDEMHDRFADADDNGDDDEDVSAEVNEILVKYHFDPKHLSPEQVRMIRNAIA